MCHGSSASDYFAVYPCRSAKPRVPWIMDLALFSIMGFVLTGCTRAPEHICRSRRTAQLRGRWKGREELSGRRWPVDFTAAMDESPHDFADALFGEGHPCKSSN